MSNQNSNGGSGSRPEFGATFATTFGTDQGQAGFGGTPSQAPNSAGSSGGEPIRDISTAQFSAEVIEASRAKPVLVDFWAPWCGPCRQLGPVLEKAVASTRGKVKLVKMNIDDHPEIAGRMGIQSIPAVVAFVDGRPKDAIMGAQPESEIRRFLEKLVGPAGPDPIEEALAEADALAADGAAAQAASLYSAILQQDPGNAAALAGLGMLYLETGDLERAKAILAAAPEPKAGSAATAEDPRLQSLRAAIDLAEQAEKLGDPALLLQRIETDPADYKARFDLALALNARGRRNEAADQLLEIFRRDRAWQEDGARTQLLQFFEAWGPTDPATLAARRKLSSLLFS